MSVFQMRIPALDARPGRRDQLAAEPENVGPTSNGVKVEAEREALSGTG